MKHVILFDMDGVLVDSEEVILKAAIAGLKEYGINANADDFKPFIGAGEDKYIGGVSEKYGVKYIHEMKKRIYDIYDEIAPQTIKVFDETKPVLQNLKDKGYKTALASSADVRKIKTNLNSAGICYDYFNAIISGEDVVNKKPHPDIYLEAAKRLKVSPEECIVIEDAINGIQSAKAAGMKCIALETSFKREILQKENPDYICTDLEEAYDYILTYGDGLV